MNKQKKITVKTGSSLEFMDKVKELMCTADQGKPVKPSHTLTFEEPSEMLAFLSKTRIKLINEIRKSPTSITKIAQLVKRNRAAVYRDIQEMELFGLVKISEAVNPGHGRHKIVQAAALGLKLEAYI